MNISIALSLPSIEIPSLGSQVYPTYITVEEGDFYASQALKNNWVVASNDQKLKALIEATKAIDTLNYAGEKTSATQLNQFPRDEETVVPEAIKEACYLIADSLLGGRDPEEEFELANITHQRHGNIASNHDSSIQYPYRLAGIPSLKAWRLILPYMPDPSAITLYRTN